MHAPAQPYRRAAAIFVLIAVLVSPLCASICGSRGCGHPSSTQNEDCHGSVATNNGAAATVIAAIRLCASQELPTADVSEVRISIHGARLGRVILPSADFFATQFRATPGFALLPPADSDPAVGNSSDSLTALRI